MRHFLSDTMKTHQEILVECWYDKTDIESITQWADTFVKNNDHIPEEVFEIFMPLNIILKIFFSD